jgi:CRISPR-associated protein Csb1
MPDLDLDLLLVASSPGGATCLTSVTELAPAAGPHASVAPAKFALPRSARGGSSGAYAYEQRYLDGVLSQAVLIDSKQSQLNRGEQALAQAIKEGHPLLSRLPRVVVTYERDGVATEYADLDLPHRVFDGHIRAGTVDGTPVTQLPAYRAIRDANPGDARALLDASPISLVMGCWDSSRATRQGRWRSTLVGEIVGFCESTNRTVKGGSRTDPVGMKIELTGSALKQLAERQAVQEGYGSQGRQARVGVDAGPRRHPADVGGPRGCRLSPDHPVARAELRCSAADPVRVGFRRGRRVPRPARCLGAERLGSLRCRTGAAR